MASTFPSQPTPARSLWTMTTGFTCWSTRNSGQTLILNRSSTTLSRLQISLSRYFIGLSTKPSGSGAYPVVFLQVLTFGECLTRRRGLCSSCKGYIYQNIVSANRTNRSRFYQFSDIRVEVNQIGYDKFKVPQQILVPRGFIPYIQQYRNARLALELSDSRLADLSWNLNSKEQAMSPIVVKNQSAAFYVQFNAKPAGLASKYWASIATSLLVLSLNSCLI